MTNVEKFTLANDVDFYVACMEFYESKNILQRNPLQTIGDRVKLIECLEKHGFTIIKNATQPRVS
jgi:hypothetical protein